MIVELLSDKGLLPKDKGPGVTAVVCAFDAELQVCGGSCLLACIEGIEGDAGWF